MVKFICFYLRVLDDEEQRIIRVREGRFACDSEETTSSEENSDDYDAQELQTPTVQPGKCYRMLARSISMSNEMSRIILRGDNA
jgi:hypothetical protein